MGPRKEPRGKRAPSAESLKELMDLLLKLNAQLREKIAPRRKEKGPEAENREMVIIILSSSSQESPRVPRALKSKPKNDWIDGLCEEIEREPGGRKSSS